MKKIDILRMGVFAGVLSVGSPLDSPEVISPVQNPGIEQGYFLPFVVEKDFDFVSDSDTTLLAKAIYGESRGELKNEQYLFGVAETIQTRLNKSRKSLREIILQTRVNSRGDTTYAYSCFSPRDVNYNKLRNPEKENWDKCYNLARKIISGEFKCPPNLKGVTNYFVGGNPNENQTRQGAIKNNIPSWAYEMDTSGKFILDSEGNRIPIKPLAIVPVGKKNAYFYKFKCF